MTASDLDRLRIRLRSLSSIEIPAVLLNQRLNPLEMAFIVVTDFPIEQRDGGKCISMKSKTDSTKTQC